MQATATVISSEPRLRRWTRDDYYRMDEAGLFLNQRVELIEGSIIVMSPQKWNHAFALTRTKQTLEPLFAQQRWVRTQAPLNLSSYSEPEPDVSVVEGSPDDYTDHPTTAVLVVEVSDTTLHFDRAEKASLYAASGIPDYWIVNLIDGQLEVLRQPSADPAQPFGYGYQDKAIQKPDDAVMPSATSGVQPISVSSLLP